MTLRLVSPAPPSAGLALAGGRAWIRRGILLQIRNVQSVAVYADGRPVAVAMFGRHGWRRQEMALAIDREAAPLLLKLVRLAQMTLSRAAETHLIVAHVDPANPAGVRMARLAGFRPARSGPPGRWVWRWNGGCDSRRRRQGGGATPGGGKPQAAADRQ